MADLSRQRCANHADREAAARCPECRRFFCRECVTEHEDRVICASCLKALSAAPSRARRGLVWLARLAQCLLSILILWFFFYLCGTVLLSIPSSFHEATVWKTTR